MTKTIRRPCPAGEVCFVCDERPATTLVIRGRTAADRWRLAGTMPPWDAEWFWQAFDDLASAQRVQLCPECSDTVIPIYRDR